MSDVALNALNFCHVGGVECALAVVIRHDCFHQPSIELSAEGLEMNRAQALPPGSVCDGSRDVRGSFYRSQVVMGTNRQKQSCSSTKSKQNVMGGVGKASWRRWHIIQVSVGR